MKLPIGASQISIHDMYERADALSGLKIITLPGGNPGYIFDRLRTLSTEVLSFIDRHNIPFEALRNNVSELGLPGAPHGWPAGSTWSQVDGLFAGEKIVAVATDGSARPDTFFHELGHAIDKALGWRSQTTQFQSLYSGDGPWNGYFAQSGGWGQKEAFAESFAQRHHMGANSATWQAAHPKTYAMWSSIPW